MVTYSTLPDPSPTFRFVVTILSQPATDIRVLLYTPDVFHPLYELPFLISTFSVVYMAELTVRCVVITSPSDVLFCPTSAKTTSSKLTDCPLGKVFPKYILKEASLAVCVAVNLTTTFFHSLEILIFSVLKLP